LNPLTGHGREGYYFGENGEHYLYDVGKTVGRVLVDLGKSNRAEPTTFKKEEIEKYFRVSIYIFEQPEVLISLVILAGLRVSWFQLTVPRQSIACYWLEAHQDHSGFAG